MTKRRRKTKNRENKFHDTIQTQNDGMCVTQDSEWVLRAKCADLYDVSTCGGCTYERVWDRELARERGRESERCKYRRWRKKRSRRLQISVQKFEKEFLIFEGAQESIPPAYLAWAWICKRLSIARKRFRGIDSARLLISLKGLQLRALAGPWDNRITNRFLAP